MEHRNSSGMDESVELVAATSRPPISIFGTGFVDSPGSSRDNATYQREGGGVREEYS
jgi:hypothetical protein